MTRLTNDMRNDLADRMIDHTFSEEVRNVCLAHADCAKMVYEDVFTSSMRERMNELPDGWLPKVASVRVQSQESVVNLTFNGYFYHLPKLRIKNHEETRMLFPYNMQSDVVAVYDGSHAIAHVITTMLAQANATSKRIEGARLSLMQTLNKFHTVEKMVEAWPEIRPIAEKITPAAKPQLPALPIAHLNELFKLPVADDV